MNPNPKLHLKKTFGTITEKLNFQGSGVTRRLETHTYWVIANFQKSSYNSGFYINIGILYKELLATQPNSDEIAMCFKSDSPFWPHVTFRIEDCPDLPDSLIESLKKTTTANTNDETQTYDVLLTALAKTVEFIKINHSRETIRNLHKKRKLNAMILKEV